MSQKLLSICIPTYNRGQILKETLDNIVLQALEFRDKVEICISNNCSTDDTEEIVMKLKEKYPDLIKYGKNEQNIGFDGNIIKVVGMAEGQFAWTFGDYSFIVDGGLKDVINFIEGMNDSNIGLVGVRQEVYVLDENNNKEVIISSQDKSKPVTIKLDAKDTIEKASLRGITHVLLNTKLIKKIYKENYNLVRMGVGGIYMHAWLYYIMFILNNNLKCHILNKVIVSTPFSPPKHNIEDYFIAILNGNIRFYGMLESICIDRDEHGFADFFSKIKKGEKISFQHNMVRFKMLDEFEYDSYFGCIKLFADNLKFKDVLLFSISFSIISLISRPVMNIIAKLYIKKKCGKKAASYWNKITKPTPKYPAKVIRKFSSKEWMGEDQIQSKF